LNAISGAAVEGLITNPNGVLRNDSHIVVRRTCQGMDKLSWSLSTTDIT
jgi:hypothetical protein